MPETDVRILIVDDDTEICSMLSALMQREGFKPFTANDGESALKAMSSMSPDAMLLDIQMPGMDGIEVIKHLEELAPELPVVVITAYGKIRGAVEAIRAGAHDYLTKPFEHNEIVRVVHRALAEGRLKRKVRSLTSRLKKDSPLRETMGPSDTVGQLISMINRVAPSNFAVIIEGETGTGKELIAHAIHNSSSHSKGAFIPVDCGAIPETLLESELFGHSKGAFTSADREKTGKIVQADGGNTACLLLIFENGRIAIFDAGTGLRKLGNDLLAQSIEQYDNIFIGLTHTHWDHIQGFPFFKPAYDIRRHFTVARYGKGRGSISLAKAFETQMQQDYFPVALDKMGAVVTFWEPEVLSFTAPSGVHVLAAEHNHPGGAYG